MSEFFNVPYYVQELTRTSDQGIAPFIQQLSNMVNKPICITDPLYQIKYQANCQDPIHVGEFLVVDYEQYLTYEPALCQISINECSYKGIITPITNKKNIIGHLIILDLQKDEHLEAYAPILGFASTLCAIQKHKKIDLKKESAKYKDAFIFDLLYGNMKDSRDIIEQGEMWSWNLTIPHAVIVFSLTEFNSFSTDRTILDSIGAIIATSFENMKQVPMMMNRKNQIVVFLPINNVKKKCEMQQLKIFAQSILDEANRLPTSSMVTCGIGNAYEEPTELFRSFQEAKIALELGLLLKIQTPFFLELGLERILYNHDLQSLKEFYYDILGDLEQYDKENDSNLLETLEAFATNQFDITKTSEVVFLHRNTLRYRLKKIEDILCLKLDDVNKRLDIVAAYKIKRLRNV